MVSLKNKVIILCVVIIVLLIIAYIIYRNLKVIIKNEEFSRILKCCIASLGNEFKSKLVVSNENPFNSILAEYLTYNTPNSFTKLSKLLYEKVRREKFTPLTKPGLIMKHFIYLIITEQTKIAYKNGFYFDKSIYDQLENLSPFVHYYCVIAKINDLYFTDVCIGKIFHNFESSLNSSFDNFMTKVTKDNYCDTNLLIMPKKVINLYLSFDHDYSFDLSNYNHLKIALFDGRAYSVCALVVRNGSNSNYRVKGGNILTNKDSSKLKTKFKIKDKSFLSVSVLMKSEL